MSPRSEDLNERDLIGNEPEPRDWGELAIGGIAGLAAILAALMLCTMIVAVFRALWWLVLG